MRPARLVENPSRSAIEDPLDVALLVERQVGDRHPVNRMWAPGALCALAPAGKLPAMESRHIDTLRRIAQADAMWAADGHEPRAFLLMYLGGMQKRIDHPRWNESWSTPGTSTIDDLAELGFLRVSGDPSKKGRAFDENRLE